MTAAPLPLRAPAGLGLGFARVQPKTSATRFLQIRSDIRHKKAVQSFLCTLMWMYSHFCAHLCACKVIIVLTYVRLQSFLCTLIWVYSHFCAHLCACTVLFVQTYVGVQSFLCKIIWVYSRLCAHLCASTVIFVHTYVHVKSFFAHLCG